MTYENYNKVAKKSSHNEADFKGMYFPQDFMDLKLHILRKQQKTYIDIGKIN